MRTLLLSFFAVCVFISGCKNTVQTSSIEDQPLEESALNGTWKLDHIQGKAFKNLYPEKIPEITFDIDNNQFNGNTSCNTFRGTLKLDGYRIRFTDPMAMTKMMCPGEGESVFLETLKKVNSYSISDYTLTFISGDTGVMRFLKKM